MAVLSIQSHVAYGHAGNAAAVFPLQRLGLEVWPINTVQLAHHTGYGAFRGGTIALDDINAALEGLGELGVLQRCRAVLSGYLGSPELGESVLSAVRAVKEANPNAIYLCDPVMGDVDTGLYVKPELPQIFRERLIAEADIITPNLFELGVLTGRTVERRLDLFQAADRLLTKGPKRLLVTSVILPDTPEGEIEMLGADEKSFWRVRTPLLPINPPVGGAGDLTAAVFLAQLLKGGDIGHALSHAASAIHGLLSTVGPGEREMSLIKQQDLFANPPVIYEAERLG
ncbi:pyridoxal kinase PdxY [Limibacillus halophilus]|jgi:pyridoxine kinase